MTAHEETQCMSRDDPDAEQIEQAKRYVLLTAVAIAVGYVAFVVV